MTSPAALILNVDDNDAARFARTRVLKHAGFDVIEATTGEAALMQIRTHLPALVLLDVKLPDMNGIDVCQRIKSDPVTGSTLVLQISAAAVRTSDKVHALESGADSYVTVPIEPAELIANVRALLRLRRAEDELREADSHKNQFLAILAHELRNPLAPIRNAVELMDPKYQASDDRIANARMIVMRQVSHLSRLVDDLLDVSRITHGKFMLKMERVDVAAAIAAAVEASRPIIDSRRHTLSISLPDEPCAVLGDHIRVAQIVTNLLSNAAKYTPESGAIQLDTRLADNRVTIRVSDNGIGISAGELPDVFNLFMQSRDHSVGSEGGLGIGLSLVKTLTEMHGGRAEAHSGGVGQGAEFIVELPAYVEEDAEPEPAPAEAAPDKVVQTQTRRVLIVDDNKDGAQSMSLLIESLGHEVRVVFDGSSAIEMTATFRPEVVILDIGMPGMDGYTVARKMREQQSTAHVLLIAITGYGHPDDFRRTREAGFDHHLVKPVVFETVEQIISQHFDHQPAV